MKKIEIKRDVERYLEKNLSIEEDIIGKIKKCLGEYLFVDINSCNKHELKGNCKGRWRLHVPHDHVVIYVIQGTKPDRHAVVIKIMTEKRYHNWVKAC
jgi:addiction module RelE/StbE family toxin